MTQRLSSFQKNHLVEQKICLLLSFFVLDDDNKYTCKWNYKMYIFKKKVLVFWYTSFHFQFFRALHIQYLSNCCRHKPSPSAYYTPPIAEILCVTNLRAIVVCGFLMKSLQKIMLKVWKKSWEPFGSCLLNSTANPAKLGWKWAGLAVLFSRYLPNGSHDFFQTFSTDFYHYSIKNPQTTIALGF